MADRPVDHKDIAKMREARTRAESSDDLQHEIGKQETGRAARFLTGQTVAATEKRKKQEQTRALSGSEGKIPGSA